MPARAVKLVMHEAVKPGPHGQLASKRSKTGNPECSRAMSAWVTGRKAGTVAAAVFAVLAKCRQQAAQNKQAALKQASGKLAKGRGTWQRSERAKILLKERAAKLTAKHGDAAAKAAGHKVLGGPTGAALTKAHAIIAKMDAAKAAKSAPPKAAAKPKPAAVKPPPKGAEAAMLAAKHITPKPAPTKAVSKPPPAKPPAPPKPAEHEHVKALKGSTGATLVKDKSTGKLLVRKEGASPGHLHEEIQADAAYRALGVPVPDSHVLTVNGKPVKFSEYHEGKTLGELRKTDPLKAAAAEKEIRKHFVADALLGNWDVVGANHDNVLVKPDGTVLRIDNGGALRYRAQGALKGATQWNGELHELDTLRDAHKNPSAGPIFSKVTKKEFEAQAKHVLSREGEVLAAVAPENREVLKKRFQSLRTELESSIGAGAAKAAATTKPATTPGPAKAGVGAWKPSPAQDFHTFTTRSEMDGWGKPAYQSWAAGLTNPEKQAISNYTATGYTWMNGYIRKKTAGPAGSLGGMAFTTVPPNPDKQIKLVESALNKGRLGRPITVWRGLRNAKGAGVDVQKMQVGDTWNDVAFGSTSLNYNTARGSFSSSSGGTVLRIRLPKGTPGAYLNARDPATGTALSNHESEMEFLLPQSAHTYRVVEKTVINGHPALTMELVL